MADTPVRLVKGKRTNTRGKKPTGNTRRVVFIPRENGEIFCIDLSTMMSIRILRSVETTVPEEVCSVELIRE